MAGHILLAEDDKALSALMQDFFRAAGVAVTPAYDGEQALVLAQEQPFDLLVLDVMMPHLNGLEVCEAVRQESDVPVIFVTALGQEGDTLAGFRAGADDYITKPFKLAVFMSRINALLRRSDNFNQTDTELSSGGISIQLLKSEVYKDNEKIELTANEYKLLHLLMENPGQVLSPEQILGKLWDCNGDYVDGNALSVYIRRLRTKIEDDPGKPERIVTVRRMGYKWNAEK